MSIEKLIETNTAEVMKLTSAIRDLIAALGFTGEPLLQIEEPAPTPEPETIEEKPKRTKKEKASDSTPETASEPTPTVEELQHKCMMLVRADRSKNQVIRDLIASFGGAKILKDVPAESLPELAKLLDEVA